MTPEQRDKALKILAAGIANKALGLDWRDTESQAKRVAERVAEVLLELTKKAFAIRNANTPYKFNLAVQDLVESVLGDLPNG